ncbi:MAG: SGNH/GDSL hydrolase family protein [Planctomycetota bacterium]
MLFLYLSDFYLLGMGTWLLALALGLIICANRYRNWKGQPRKVRWVQWGLALWTTVAMLTGVELFYALFYDQTDSFSMTNVSQRWYDLHVVRNRQGYRDDHPFLQRAADDRKRIVFLGDSFTFGHGVAHVADRFSDRIAASLEKVHPRQYEVANLGSPGHGTPEAVKILRDQILAEDYQVDVLVYAICLNDIESFHAEKSQRDVQRGSRKPSFFLFRDTYFFNLMYFRSQQFTQPEVRDYFSYLRSYYTGEPWQQMQLALDEFLDLAKDHQIDTRVVLFPFLQNLGPNYPFKAAHHQLVEYFRQRGIRVLDLEPILASHAQETLTVNRFDAHPNAKAHQLAAEAIQMHLLDDVFQKSN